MGHEPSHHSRTRVSETVKQGSLEAGFTVSSERKSNIQRLKKGQTWLLIDIFGMHE